MCKLKAKKLKMDVNEPNRIKPVMKHNETLMFLIWFSPPRKTTDNCSDEDALKFLDAGNRNFTARAIIIRTQPKRENITSTEKCSIIWVAITLPDILPRELPKIK
ncbi:hypothetical protein LOCUS_51450 [Klebsiella pneumoniae]|nr:hypothetical protein KML001_49380 [Klebsiella quasipneumoniae subsp. similipneumoniae]GMA04412.1 hypothetical protein KML003_45370 [Klebsiella quasipneumoniae subsp. similipneumoniae]GMX30305.1 hypothetical protein LOCUS_51450 [Klebsiella pneumoniae]